MMIESLKTEYLQNRRRHDIIALVKGGGNMWQIFVAITVSLILILPITICLFLIFKWIKSGKKKSVE